MDIQNFIKNFSDQFEATDPSVFTPETNFWELEEWSSLIALSIVSMIDEEYNVAIKSADIKGIKTIGELYSVVCNKQDA